MGRKNVVEFVYDCEEMIKDKLSEIDKISFFNSMKVLNAMHDEKISSSHFESTTGYGYDDIGRDAIERVYAKVFRCEDALVRSQFISGTHALTVALFAFLRPGDVMLSITGKPYDTLEEVIGIRGNASGSLKDFGVNYRQVDMVDSKVDFESLKYAIDESVKAVIIQRSKGYDWRDTYSVEKIGEIIKFVKSIREDIICIVDNCYGEFVETTEPCSVGADLIVGTHAHTLQGIDFYNGKAIIYNLGDFIFNHEKSY